MPDHLEEQDILLGAYFIRAGLDKSQVNPIFRKETGNSV